MEYPSFKILVLTRLWREQCLVGSLSGALASKKVTEAFKGQLAPDGNRSGRAKA